MADSDKNIIITPFRGQTSQPQIRFVGKGNDPITIRVTDGVSGPGLTAGGALSFEGSAGQLFSVINRLGTGSIFNVNNISGIPSIDVDAVGFIQIAPYSGNVGVGYTGDPGFKFAVTGGTAYFNNLAIFNSGISASGLASFVGGISLSNGITFSDGSFQVTKTQDFLLFIQGII